MISFYLEEYPTSTMKTKTDDIGSLSENGMQDTLETVFVGIPGEYPSEDGEPINALENAHGSSSFNAVEPQHDDWVDVNTPSRSSEQSGSHPSHENPAELRASYYEHLIKTVAAERDSANSRCEEAEAATRTESERFEEQIWFAEAAAQSARVQANREMARFRKQAIQDYKKMQAARDKALQDLSEAKAQLAAIDKRENDRPSCQDCRNLAEEIIKEALKVKDLEAEMEQLDRDLEIAQGLITGYKNSFAITDKIINEQHAEIAEQKAEIAEQKAEIARLNAKLAELQEVPESSPGDAREEEDLIEELIQHTDGIEHSTSDHPLVMRIVVWVGGEHGTDTELALVKMKPDTWFKAVLEDLRGHHPLKALKQKNTGRWIFETDTPAHLGVKDGEELVFIQQADEPMYMFDTTIDGAECWRGKDSRV